MFSILKRNTGDKPVKDYIKVYENIIDNNLCDLIINEFAESHEWQGAAVGKSAQIDRSTRNVDGIPLSNEDVIKDNWEIRTKIDAELFKAATKAVYLYNKDFPHCKIQEDTGYGLLRYKEGQFYKEHVDSFKQEPRSMTAVFALNDDYEGGEFSFFQKDVIYKIKKGSVLIFPSNFMYPHEVLTVTKGTRYSIITWFI